MNILEMATWTNRSASIVEDEIVVTEINSDELTTIFSFIIQYGTLEHFILADFWHSFEIATKQGSRKFWYQDINVALYRISYGECK